jgi:TatD DNase family protein
VGEIGLDYHYDFSARGVQHEVFRVQVRLARELDRPVVIHTREADDDTMTILKEEGGGELRGVLHCFTGTAALAQAALGLGFYISAAGIVTFPKAGELRNTLQQVPIDRLLTETDSPFLAPVPFRGKRNEPAYVARVVEQLASLHGVTSSEMAERTTANFHTLFRP